MSDEVDALFIEPERDPQRAGAFKGGPQRGRGRQKMAPGTKMIRTTVYLRPDQHRWMNEYADRVGVSFASIIRTALDKELMRLLIKDALPEQP